MNRSTPNLLMDDFQVEESIRQDIKHNQAQEQLAKELGYQSARQMMEQTEIVLLPSGCFTYLTTDCDGYWVAWNDWPEYDIQRFDSRHSALTTLYEYEASVLCQS